MTVAGRSPFLKAPMICTSSSLGRAARLATAEFATGLPEVPWHAAQFAAIERTPFSARFGAANAGGGGAGCCAATPVATRVFMGFGLPVGLHLREYRKAAYKPSCDGYKWKRPRGRGRFTKLL